LKALPSSAHQRRLNAFKQAFECLPYRLLDFYSEQKAVATEMHHLN